MESIYNHFSGSREVKLTRIKVKNLRLRAYIGFKEWETRKLQDLVISYSFRYNAAKAIKTDAAADALDYKKINKAIISLVDRQRFNLLEKTAEEIYRIIKKNVFTRDVCVRVEKPYALRFTDNVMAEISDEDRTNEVIIGLGSNIRPEENIKKAMEHIQKLGRIRKKTKFIYTKPERKKDQPDFLNGALVISTDQYYEDLYDRLKSTEDLLGRDRSGDKNGPRIIDLDIVAFNDTITDEEVYEYEFLKNFVAELKPELLAPQRREN